jgi:hypothetical protein
MNPSVHFVALGFALSLGMIAAGQAQEGVPRIRLLEPVLPLIR